MEKQCNAFSKTPRLSDISSQVFPAFDLTALILDLRWGSADTGTCLVLGWESCCACLIIELTTINQAFADLFPHC